MSQKLISLKEFYASYKKWVSNNPQLLSDLEATTKWISYLIAGRITQSSILSELIYSLSNVIVLFNDRIIEKSYGLTEINESNCNTLKLMLTTLEYCEVFIEISAKKLWGTKGRWILIVIVQLIKSIGRYLLMYHYTEDIIRVPLIPVLDRKKIPKQQLQCQLQQQQRPSSSTASSSLAPTGIAFDNCSFTFKLKRSGRIIRKIEGAPPIQLRNWKSLNNTELNTTKSQSVILKTAEGLYIAKPLIHLGAVGLFGYKSWKSYTISLLLDLVSIRMYYNNRHQLTKQQRVELSRRCVNLLLYFVRSPLYEKTTEKRLKSFIKGVGNSIPLMGSICNPLAEYIPHWQDTYFYMWSS